MPLDSRIPVDRLGSEQPQLRRHLGRLGVDLQAEGGLTLTETAERHGLDLRALQTALAAVPAEPQGVDWAQAGLRALLSHLVGHHHGYTRDALAELGELLDQALEQVAAHPELVQVRVHFRELEQDLLAHFKYEEQSLFPDMLATQAGAPVPESLSTPAEQGLTLEAEHHAVEELFQNLRMITSDYALPAGAGLGLRRFYLGLRDLEDDLHRHIYLENHLLFPRLFPDPV